MSYSSHHRRLGLKLKPNGRGELPILIEQYANQVADLIQPAARDRLSTHLTSKELVLNLAWAAIHAASIKGVSETLEELDDARYHHRLARKRHSDS